MVVVIGMTFLLFSLKCRTLIRQEIQVFNTLLSTGSNSEFLDCLNGTRLWLEPCGVGGFITMNTYF